MLKPFVVGIPSLPWTASSLPLLAVLSAMCVGFYAQKGVAEDDFYWVKRVKLNSSSADDDGFMSVNLKTGEEILDEKPALRSSTSRAVLKVRSTALCALNIFMMPTISLVV